MDIATFIVLLVSLLSPGHSVLAKIDNENLDYMRYAYIRTIEENMSTKEYLEIINCESGFNEQAFNPETLAKKKGITKYSSCGLTQNNDPRCGDKKPKLTSEIYDPFYSIDLGIEKYKERGWWPWKECATKLGIIK